MKRSFAIDLQFQNSVDSGVGKVTAAARLVNNGGIGPRALDCYAFVYHFRGHGWFADELGTRVDVAPGSGFLLFPGVTHEYYPQKGKTWDELYLLFEGAAFDLWRDQGLLDPSRPLTHLEPVELWAKRVGNLWMEFSNPLDQVCRLQAFLVEAGFVEGARPAQEGERDWLDEARERLRRVDRSTEGVEEVARRMGMSAQTFRKRFSREQGSPPARYQMSCVMEYAARRLTLESISVKELALDLGFCDEFHFSHRFKQLIGVSPTAYRARLNATINKMG